MVYVHDEKTDIPYIIAEIGENMTVVADTL